jgi:hypothetical protein
VAKKQQMHHDVAQKRCTRALATYFGARTPHVFADKYIIYL